MPLFRRKRAGQEGPHRWVEATRSPTELLGIADHDLARSNFTPYEFDTDGGVQVYVHDMRFLGFRYRAEPPTLTIRFVYDQPEYTPPQAVATPVAVFEFRGVQVWQWKDDVDLLQTPAEYRGQVSDFGYDELTNALSLGTLDTNLLFSADRLRVALEPLPGA